MWTGFECAESGPNTPCNFTPSVLYPFSGIYLSKGQVLFPHGEKLFLQTLQHKLLANSGALCVLTVSLLHSLTASAMGAEKASEQLETPQMDASGAL